MRVMLTSMSLRMMYDVVRAQEVELEDLPDDFEEHPTLHQRLNAGGGDGGEPLLA